MIKIHPEIEFMANCPEDGAQLEIKEIVIPNMRCLVDATCPICSNNYYVDLPVGHGLLYPMVINKDSLKIYDQYNIKWFNELLQKSLLEIVKTDIVPKVHHFLKSDKIIILNCLDFLYGHSLLKLLNTQRYIKNYSDLGCCVLVPSQLVHLVPDGVAEIWEFPVSIKEGWKWYHSLDNWIHQQIQSKQEVYLSKVYPHPLNQTYNLNNFAKDLPDISEEIKNKQPIILLSYREDRLWGRTLSHQQQNIQNLYDKLSNIFPELAFILIGFGHKNIINSNHAKIIDLRIDSFNRERDKLWIAYMSIADCAVGVHGSNMLLPSGLAKSTVELVPKDRFGNSVQDFLFPQSLTVQDALLYYRMIYGNNHLSDVEVNKVVDLIVNMFMGSKINSTIFQAENIEIQSIYQEIAKNPIFQKSKTYASSYKETFLRKVKRRLISLILFLPN